VNEERREVVWTRVLERTVVDMEEEMGVAEKGDVVDLGSTEVY